MVARRSTHFLAAVAAVVAIQAGTFTHVADAQVSGGAWVKRLDSTATLPVIAFYNMAWDGKRQRAYALQYEGSLYAYSPVTNQWSLLLANGIDTRHNCTIVYDPVNDRVWLSLCAPGSTGAFYYDPVANAWIVQNAAPQSMPSGDPGMVFDPARQILIGFGGWGTPGRVWTYAVAPPAANWTVKQLVPDELFADMVTDAGKETNARSGFDSLRGRAWYVATDGALWTYDVTTDTWTKHATTGGPPPVFTAYVHDPDTDIIVGWSGYDGWESADPLRRQTWLLNLTTYQWTPGPAAASGAVVPPGGVYSALAMVHDPGRHQVILRTLLGGLAEAETWAFDVSGTGSPPPSPPPVVDYSLTVSSTGSGSGSTGPTSGSYPAGVVVSLVATPTAGSLFAGWSGHFDCVDGSVTMSGPRDCVATFELNPTPPPPPPTTTPPPPPPTTTYQLSLSQTGSGSGTVAPAGTYPSGSVVTLTATPASGSIFDGWLGDADCVDGSITISGPRLCIATFTLVSTPPPTPPSGSLPLRTWVARALPPLTSESYAADQTPFHEGGSGTKDVGVTFDALNGVIVYGTGDVSPNPPGANGPIVANYTYRTGTNEWARISDHCPASGEIPSWPTDRGPYVYDPVRHGLWVWQSPFFSDRNGEECAPGQAVRHNGLFFFNLSARTWTRRTDAAEFSNNQGNAAFDATTNSLLVVRPFACPGIGTGSTITAYNIGVVPLTTTDTPVCITRTPTFPASQGWIPPQLASRNYPAWDPTTRTMYFCGQIQRSDGVTFAAECYKYHRPSNTVSLLPPPPVDSPPQHDYYTTLVWDSVAQRVLWPVVKDACAHLQEMLAYDPATNTWETVPHTGVAPVIGSSIVYDPVANAVVMVGSVFCGDQGLPGQTHLYLYRHSEP
jgi:Divergent InlB B-repeat domain